jgi:multidrug efflux pump
MAKFFIERPIFAWVVAIFIMVLGVVSINQLPIAQYPAVAPPTIQVSVTYPGADAETMGQTVLEVIEREMNGAQGLVYMEAVAQGNGTGTLTLSFEQEIDPNMAQVDVQNRLSRAEPRLPAAVTQQGVKVEQSRSNFLMFGMLVSKTPDVTNQQLNDYAARNVVPELQRITGVGKISQFGAETAMRIWLDAAKLKGYDLSPAQVNSAISAQNVQVSSGTLGELPAAQGQTIAATIVVHGQLLDEKEFGNIVLRANTDGSTVRLRDVARIELGAQSYNTTSRLNGQAAVGMAVQPTPTANALETATLVKAKLAELKPFFPAGVDYTVPYDTTTFISVSIEKVVHTLLEAIVLVFLVMYLFLQNFRYTIIPTIVVPVALLGTFAALFAMGFSINVLTMFGMVLVIGIVVDDAIVVVENVERIMSEEGLPPLQATRKAMGQITGAVVGVTVVLIAVFVPLAFFSGSTGNIYRQFAATMATSIGFSAFLALSLTPALCATLLKPVEAGHHHEKKGFFGWFNRVFARTTRTYGSGMARVLPRAGRLMIIYALLVGVVAFIYMRLPTSFLPNEDQGYIITNVQTPAGASQERTLDVIKQVEGFMRKQPEVENVVSVAGFSFSGQGQNVGLLFVTFKDWAERGGPGHTAQAIAGRAMKALYGLRDSFIIAISPPPIAELGNATGFTFRLQDRGSMGHDALLAARNQLLGMAAQSKVLTGVRPDGLEDAPQMSLDIDRDKANALGVSFDAISNTLSTALGSTYVNDFPNRGRMQRVVVQAESSLRMQPEKVLDLPVLNNSGQAVPLSAFATTSWKVGPAQVVRYNGYPAMKIAGDPAAGYSTGDAMAEMERLATHLPAGFGFEWTGQSREEKLAGSQAMVLYGFAVLAVFLCLAALYESWSIPFSVLLVVPLGVIGVLLATLLRNMPNDVYFQIGLITIIGLSAKNAILIIEFAKDLQAQGKGLLEAALEASHMRFRPIIMTSLAFTLGVVPLAIATGASSASQRAIGTGVIGGMITGTVLALVFVPAFFVLIRSFFKGSERQHQHDSKLVKQHLEEANRVD